MKQAVKINGNVLHCPFCRAKFFKFRVVRGRDAYQSACCKRVFDRESLFRTVTLMHQARVRCLATHVAEVLPTCAELVPMVELHDADKTLAGYANIYTLLVAQDYGISSLPFEKCLWLERLRGIHSLHTPHHPEYWDLRAHSVFSDDPPFLRVRKVDARKMPKLFLAEMVCDWMAEGLFPSGAWVKDTYEFLPAQLSYMTRVRNKICERFYRPFSEV